MASESNRNGIKSRGKPDAGDAEQGISTRKRGHGQRAVDQNVGMATIKILFSHVQVVAIAASFKLAWPDDVIRLFNTMGSVSSVSSEVLSLDCMLQQSAGELPEAGAVNGQAAALEAWTAILQYQQHSISSGWSAENSTIAEMHDAWSGTQLQDERLLAQTLAIHEENVLGVDLQRYQSGLAASMPHGSAYFLRTIVVLLSPLLLALGLALFWVIVDAIDGCLHEPDYIEIEEPEEEGGPEEAGRAPFGGGIYSARPAGGREGKPAPGGMSKQRMSFNPLARARRAGESVLAEPSTSDSKGVVRGSNPSRSASAPRHPAAVSTTSNSSIGAGSGTEPGSPARRAIGRSRSRSGRATGIVRYRTSRFRSLLSGSSGASSRSTGGASVPQSTGAVPATHGESVTMGPSPAAGLPPAAEYFWLASSYRTGTVLGCVGVPLAAVKLPLGMRILSGLTVIAFLVHLTLTEASFGLLSCTTLEPDVDLADGDDEMGSLAVSPAGHDECPEGEENRRLVLDLDVCCYNPSALQIMYGVGVPAILVFAVGIPLLAGLRLWWVSDRLRAPDVIATMGFLTAGFNEHAYYWEVVIMLRKLAVVAITVLVEPMGVRVQTYSAIAVIFAAAVLHSLNQPYEATSLNTLELVALVGAFLTFEAGLFLHDENSSDEVKTAATMVVFLANLSVLLWCLWVLRWEILGKAREVCYFAGSLVVGGDVMGTATAGSSKGIDSGADAAGGGPAVLDSGTVRELSDWEQKKTPKTSSSRAGKGAGSSGVREGNGEEA